MKRIGLKRSGSGRGASASKRRMPSILKLKMFRPVRDVRYEAGIRVRFETGYINVSFCCQPIRQVLSAYEEVEG